MTGVTGGTRVGPVRKLGHVIAFVLALVLAGCQPFEPIRERVARPSPSPSPARILNNVSGRVPPHDCADAKYAGACAGDPPLPTPT
jgi:hypothetical protein